MLFKKNLLIEILVHRKLKDLKFITNIKSNVNENIFAKYQLCIINFNVLKICILHNICDK